MKLAVLCTAYALTQDDEYRQTAGRLAGVLLTTQAANGSWNNLTQILQLTCS